MRKELKTGVTTYIEANGRVLVNKEKTLQFAKYSLSTYELFKKWGE